MDIYSLDYARFLDTSDMLKEFRKRFFLDPNMIYLDGNSLGVLPAETSARMDEVVNDEWGRGLIRSWNSHWIGRSKKIAAKLAPLIGAREDEVIITDSTSVNLFKLAWAALDFARERKAIVTDELNFPSDIYLLQGLVKMFGDRHHLRLARSSDGAVVTSEELEKQLSDDTALLTLSHVVFKSAFMYDMKEITALAHEKGAMVLWDLSHATGAVHVDLNGASVDLAVGCTYKYLNGGPGSPAFLYVRKDLQEKLLSPIWGWFGQNNPFEFKLEYTPAPGIDRFFAGTPPVISLSSLEPAVDLMLQAGIDNVRAKSITQTNYLISLFAYYLEPLGFTLGSPDKAEMRGSHISLKHPEAYRICKALIDPEAGHKIVIPDFREPDNIRLGIASLYTSFEDIFDAVTIMRDVIAEGWYENYSLHKEQVT
jgi:kynureninase